MARGLLERVCPREKNGAVISLETHAQQRGYQQDLLFLVKLTS